MEKHKVYCDGNYIGYTTDNFKIAKTPILDSIKTRPLWYPLKNTGQLRMSFNITLISKTYNIKAKKVEYEK